MTPAARLQAAIDILDALASSSQPADRALKAWGAAHRYAGSGDRRAIADRVYLCLREQGRLGGGGGRALVLASLRYVDGLDPEAIAALFSGARFAPAPLDDAEKAGLTAPPDAAALGLPDFIEEELRASFGHEWRAEAEALLRTRAALDLRVNTAKATVEQVRAALGAEPTPWSAVGLRLEGAPDLTARPEFAAGQFEVQDEGSQLAAFLAGGGRLTVDYCAGGGGKTLALAAGAPDGARLIACDVDPRRLDAIAPRLARAGARAELRRLGEDGHGLEDLAGRADLVLVDAPCSASGTWRRRPEAAWRLNAAELDRLGRLQPTIIERAARLVRPGGRLAYVTCSVLACENDAVVDAFAGKHAQFRPLAVAAAAETPNLTDAARTRLAALSAGRHTVQLSPRRTGTDGFFIALFERSS